MASLLGLGVPNEPDPRSGAPRGVYSSHHSDHVVGHGPPHLLHPMLPAHSHVHLHHHHPSHMSIHSMSRGLDPHGHPGDGSLVDVHAHARDGPGHHDVVSLEHHHVQSMGPSHHENTMMHHHGLHDIRDPVRMSGPHAHGRQNLLSHHLHPLHLDRPEETPNHGHEQVSSDEPKRTSNAYRLVDRLRAVYDYREILTTSVLSKVQYCTQRNFPRRTFEKWFAEYSCLSQDELLQKIDTLEKTHSNQIRISKPKKPTVAKMDRSRRAPATNNYSVILFKDEEPRMSEPGSYDTGGNANSPLTTSLHHEDPHSQLQFANHPSDSVSSLDVVSEDKSHSPSDGVDDVVRAFGQDTPFQSPGDEHSTSLPLEPMGTENPNASPVPPTNQVASPHSDNRPKRNIYRSIDKVRAVLEYKFGPVVWDKKEYCASKGIPYRTFDQWQCEYSVFSKEDLEKEIAQLRESSADPAFATRRHVRKTRDSRGSHPRSVLRASPGSMYEPPFVSMLPPGALIHTHAHGPHLHTLMDHSHLLGPYPPPPPHLHHIHPADLEAVTSSDPVFDTSMSSLHMGVNPAGVMSAGGKQKRASYRILDKAKAVYEYEYSDHNSSKSDFCLMRGFPIRTFDQWLRDYCRFSREQLINEIQDLEQKQDKQHKRRARRTRGDHSTFLHQTSDNPNRSYLHDDDDEISKLQVSRDHGPSPPHDLSLEEDMRNHQMSLQPPPMHPVLMHSCHRPHPSYDRHPDDEVLHHHY